MKHIIFFAINVIIIMIISSCSNDNSSQTINNQDIRQDYFINRGGDISKESFHKFRNAISLIRNQPKSQDFQKPWKLEGPLNVNGRVNIVATHPSNSKIWLVGESTGGIYKTINRGQSYYSVFDNYNYLSISEIVYHPKNNNLVFAGTGDENISGYPFSGDGVYKSTDGGETWAPFALQNMGIISTICIHPTQPDTMYVASMGVPYVADSLRGVFRTYDGGIHWQQVLLPDTTAGVIDMIIDYNNPQTIYAVGWNRVRSNHISLVKGAQSQLYVSYNGGNSWQIKNITGSSATNSRIGIAQTKTSNNRIYATVVDSVYALKGVFYSNNAAASWQSLNIMNVSGIYSGFGWYFGQIRVNPFNPNKIYLPGVMMSEYNVQNSSWSDITALHVDHHDLDFISEDSLIASTDGGLFLSTNGGQSWSDIDDIPSTQFYRIAFNPNVLGEYWGGLQDNGTVKGTAASLNNWSHMYGGDGFQVVFDRVDPSIVYVETQNGGLSYLQYGLSMGSFDSGIDWGDRRSWDMPIINDKNNDFYTGTYRIYKNTMAPNGTWQAKSTDLTDGNNSRFHVITSLGVSEINSNFVYAGTSDGHVWRSINAGNFWLEITHNLPNLYVTSIEASPNYANTVYVGHSGYRDNITTAHIHKSTDKGNSWTNIAGDLPDMAVNAIVVLPHNDDSILFVATDGGVYGTLNSGANWLRVGNNMPIIPVYDLVFDSLARNLVAGTYARAMYSIPIDSIIPQLVDNIHFKENKNSFTVFPNPAQDILFIDWAEHEPITLELWDSEGKKVKQIRIENTNYLRMNMSDLKPGLYFLKIQKSGETSYRKIIKI